MLTKLDILKCLCIGMPELLAVGFESTHCFLLQRQDCRCTLGSYTVLFLVYRCWVTKLCDASYSHPCSTNQTGDNAGTLMASAWHHHRVIYHPLLTSCLLLTAHPATMDCTCVCSANQANRTYLEEVYRLRLRSLAAVDELIGHVGEW